MIVNKFRKKADVPIRNFVTLLFIISFALVFLIECSTALACFCGRCLPTASQDTNLKIKSTSSKGSSSGNSRICNFVKVKAIKGIDFSKQAFDSKHFFTSNMNASTGSLSYKRSVNNISFFYGCGITRLLPVYLQTLSIRC